MQILKLSALFLACTALSPVTHLLGDDVATAREKLEKSIAELAAVRTTIATEREPLAAELRRLENEVIELRRTRERMQRMVDNQSVDLASLENQVKAYQDESAYVVNLLADYFNRSNASLSVAEVGEFQHLFLDVLNRGEADNTQSFDRLAVQIPSLDGAIGRLESLAGGLRIPGSAVLPGGQVANGTFAIMGPVTYFATADGNFGGIVLRGSSERPALIEFDRRAVPTISNFISNGSGPFAGRSDSRQSVGDCHCRRNLGRTLYERWIMDVSHCLFCMSSRSSLPASRFFKSIQPRTCHRRNWRRSWHCIGMVNTVKRCTWPSLCQDLGHAWLRAGYTTLSIPRS
ncbi:MAG: DUF3450 domain-containing protein [Verrucomicrobia bacterium]|nr:DUF3450 domain-containing protein [Verrucomicrobiota bacterium]